MYPGGFQLIDDRHGVGLGTGQGRQVADLVRVTSPDATPEPGDVGQRGGRLGQADGCEQLIEPARDSRSAPTASSRLVMDRKCR